MAKETSLCAVALAVAVLCLVHSLAHASVVPPTHTLAPFNTSSIVAKERQQRFVPLHADTASFGFVHIAKCAGASYINELKHVFTKFYPGAPQGAEQ